MTVISGRAKVCPQCGKRVPMALTPAGRQAKRNFLLWYFVIGLAVIMLLRAIF